MVYIGKYIKHYKVHYGTYGSLNTNYLSQRIKRLFHLQYIFSQCYNSFDVNDEDWACDEVFDTREVPLRWELKTTWEDVLDETSCLISEYLEKGKYAEKLKSYKGLSDVMLCSICLIYMKMEEILPIKTLKRDLAINRCKDIFLSS